MMALECDKPRWLPVIGGLAGILAAALASVGGSLLQVQHGTRSWLWEVCG